ncbi:MAG TPA: twin-arginine translocation signal domain-containing protein [Pyrinomonadaceae bacterium]
MQNFWSRRRFLKGAGLMALLLTTAVVPARAQDERQTRYAVERAQIGVSGKILQERGGTWNDVTFDQARTQTWRISDRLTGVRGAGRYAPGGSDSRAFTYEAAVNHRNGNIERVTYEWVRGGGGVGGGDNRRVPRWLVGSWSGRSPSNQRRVSLTVGSDGQVSALYNNGSREEGRYENGRIRFNNSNEWDVSRVDGGMRAAYGTRSEVFRSGTGGGNDDDDETDGRVPRWMRGTFRGTTDDGEAELVIRADGTATIGAVGKSGTARGTYSDGRLRFDWGTYEVERLQDGIRTVNVKDRNNRTDYRRTGN